MTFRFVVAALWCAIAIKGVLSQSTPDWIPTSPKAVPSASALSKIPPTSSWPFVVSSYMSTCGAPWHANRTMVTSPCPQILRYNDTALEPRWPERPATLSALFNASGLSHLAQDTSVMEEMGSRIDPRSLMGLVLLSCEQFYVQWIVNATGGRYPPPRGLWDPRCACADALDYTMSAGIIRHYNTQFRTPLETLDNPRGIDFLGPLWYDMSNFTTSQLGGQNFKDYWQKLASINSTSELEVAQPVWRYTREPTSCRVDSRVLITSQFTVPQTSTRSPYFVCTANPFGQGPGLVWGTDEYIACHQRDTWDWFWSIPPETVSTRPAEYRLLRIVQPVAPPTTLARSPPVGTTSPLSTKASESHLISPWMFITWALILLLSTCL